MGFLYLSGFGIGTFALSIIIFFSVAYYFQVKNKSKSTFWFSLFLLSIGIVFLMLSLIYTVLEVRYARLFWWILHVFVYGSISLVMFVYNYPENYHIKESRIVFPLFMVLSTLSLIAYIIQSLYVEPQFVNEVGLYAYQIPAPGAIIGLEFGWFFIVILRKIALLSDYEYNGKYKIYLENKQNGFRGLIKRFIAESIQFSLKIMKTRERYSLALRHFIFIFLNASFALVTVMLALLGLISWLFFTYFTSIIILIIFFWLIAFLLDNSPEPSSFMVKLMGGSLLISLVIMGVIGVIAIQERERTYHSNRIREVSSLTEYLSTENNAAIPRDLDYIAELEPSGNAILHYSNSAKTAPIRQYLSEVKRTDILKDSLQTDRSYFFKGEKNDPAQYFNVYYFFDGDRVFEAGYDYVAYRQEIHEISLLIWIIIPFVAIILLIALPLFFKNNMTRPVARLLEGFHKVNEGFLDVKVPVLIKDEFGIIGESFNGMVSSIRDARKRLQDYADHLEEMVSTRTAELVEAKKETDEIMKNVDEGLLLIYAKDGLYSIGSQYSKELENIFMEKYLSGRDLVHIISLYCESGVSDNARKYLNLMFRPAIEEESLFEMNPLVDVQFVLDEKKKFLNFKFRRVMKDDIIEYLIVTVVDVTEQILLQQRLQKTESENKTRMEMLFKLLHVDPAMLSDFMEGAFEEMNKINEILKEQKDREQMVSRLEEMHRYVHTVKGNAALLDLDFIVDIAHRLEDKMGELRWKDDLKGEEFIPVTILYQNLYSMLDEMKDLVGKLLSFQESFGEASGKVTSIVLNAVKKTIEKMSAQLGKKAHLKSDGFSLDAVSAKQRILIKDILIQLIRNSIGHGIELPEERTRTGKNESGEIQLKSFLEHGNFIFSVRDDGKGFHLDMIKERALTAGIVSAEDISSWNDEQIAALIFKSGLSTADSVTTISGRGVGMDIIKMKVEKAGGSISFTFSPGIFTEFTITLPVI